MNIQRLPSDVIGLSKVMPPLSRRGFMSSSAAAAAGYTLAAGPVRADAIQTDSKGLDAGMAKVAVSGGDMPVYFAKPSGAKNPPVILICMEIFGLHEWVKDITRRVGHLGALAIAPNYYFRAETNGVDRDGRSMLDQNLARVLRGAGNTADAMVQLLDRGVHLHRR